MAGHPARTELESGGELYEQFRADLVNAKITRHEICVKYRVSAGYVSSRRQELRDNEQNAPVDQAVTTLSAGESDQIKTQADGKHMEFIRSRPVTLEDGRDLVRATGDNPDDYHIAIRAIGYGKSSDPQSSNKISVWPKVGGKDGEPAWPVAQPARDRIIIQATPAKHAPIPLVGTFRTAVIGADTQIGFDMDDGRLTPYHDDSAIDIFLQVLAIEKPQQSILAGDILDLAEQGRWTQEARFANTTQHALDRSRELAAAMREFTPGEVHWIEGNHDKRMQGFMEANAKASMGLRKAGYPDSWPVMSIPNLVGLDEFRVNYVDAYPAGVHWVTNGLRVIHGTKANSKGSTASQYANQMPHISTIFGHTHRLEVQSKTTFDRAGKIRTMNVNPGCLCRIDGAVPSVHGARHLDGKKATYWEDWQQGVAVIRYREDGKFYVELVQIDDGVGFHGGQELVAAEVPSSTAAA